MEKTLQIIEQDTQIADEDLKYRSIVNKSSSSSSFFQTPISHNDDFNLQQKSNIGQAIDVKDKVPEVNPDQVAKKLDDQINSLIRNERVIMKYHKDEDKESKHHDNSDDYSSSSSSESAKTVSSLNEDDCRLIFQENYKYRFEADDRIRRKSEEEI